MGFGWVVFISWDYGCVWMFYIGDGSRSYCKMWNGSVCVVLFVRFNCLGVYRSCLKFDDDVWCFGGGWMI